MNATLEVLDFGDGEGRIFLADAGGALPDVDQPVLVSIDEWLEEHAPHEGKDGRVGPDPNR